MISVKNVKTKRLGQLVQFKRCYAQTQFIPGTAERCHPIRVFPVLPDPGAVEAVEAVRSSKYAACPAVPSAHCALTIDDCAFAKVGEKVLAMRSAIGKTRERTNVQTYGASSFNALHVHACMRTCVRTRVCVLCACVFTLCITVGNGM